MTYEYSVMGIIPDETDCTAPDAPCYWVMGQPSGSLPGDAGPPGGALRGRQGRQPRRLQGRVEAAQLGGKFRFEGHGRRLDVLAEGFDPGPAQRIASMGDSRAARKAGYNPKMRESANATAQAVSRPSGFTTSP